MKFLVHVERTEVATYEVEASSHEEAVELFTDADEVSSEVTGQAVVGIQQMDDEPRPTAEFTCRDIGYGVETGEVFTPATGPADWVGKRPYLSSDGITTVYLFDDEVSR